MLSDPQSVTFNAVTYSLARISAGADQSVYAYNDTTGFKLQLTVLHAFGKRNRAVASLSWTGYSADPLVPANSILVQDQASLSINWPQVGVTTPQVNFTTQALLAWAAASGLALRIANGET